MSGAGFLYEPSLCGLYSRILTHFRTGDPVLYKRDLDTYELSTLDATQLDTIFSISTGHVDDRFLEYTEEVFYKT